MAEPNPIEHEDLFNVITLGGVRSPGVVTLTGHDRVVNWDVKGAHGQQGASTTLKDIPPGTFKASFYLADLDDINAWPAFQEVIESTVSGTTPKALDVYHPDLARNKFRSVVKAKVYGVVHDKKGGQTIAVDFQEYAPPKPKGGSVNGSTSKAKQKDPNQDLQDEIARLTNQYQNTPWG